jgi:glyoxylase-like metal-dependent hydrolase (beta-lactamase superfamily II)
MKRSVLLLSVAALAAYGQGTDYSKVEIKTTKLTNNYYTLEGSGGTIGALVGPEGVFMVDGEFAPLTDKIIAAIRKISPTPIRFMVNTHVHGDHTGGNENFAKQGVTIFARTELRDRLAHPAPAANGAPGAPAPAAALPVITYDDPIAFHFNGEEIRLVPIRHAHTDGDTLVHFVNNDVIMTGDFYRSLGYPNIDRANGGSLKGMLEGLSQVVAMAGPNTKIVPGHGVVVDRNAVAAHRDMLMVLRDRVAALISQGKTQDEVVAAKPTADYDAKVPDAANTSTRILTQLYAEIKATK